MGEFFFHPTIPFCKTADNTNQILQIIFLMISNAQAVDYKPFTAPV